MTVGQALMKKTGLRLFHNHMTIEPTVEIFGAYNGNVVQRLRQVIFEEFVKSDNEGMILPLCGPLICRRRAHRNCGKKGIFYETFILAQ